MDKIVKAMLIKGATKKNFYNTDVPLTEEELYETLRYIPKDALYRALDEKVCLDLHRGFNINELLDNLSAKGKLKFLPYIVRGTYALCIAYNRFICPTKGGYSFAVYDTPDGQNVPIRTYFNSDKIIELIETVDADYGVDMRQLVALYSLVAALTENRDSYYVVEQAMADYMRDIRFGTGDSNALCLIDAWKQHSCELEDGPFAFTEAWKKSSPDTPESVILKYLMLFVSSETKLPDTQHAVIHVFDENSTTDTDVRDLTGYQVGNGTILFWIDNNDIIVKVRQDIPRTYRIVIPNIPFSDASISNIPKSKMLPFVKQLDFMLTLKDAHRVYSDNKSYMLELAVTFALNLFGVRVDRDGVEVIVPRDTVTDNLEDYITFRGLNSFTPWIK